MEISFSYHPKNYISTDTKMFSYAFREHRGHLEEYICHRVWSPIVWREGKRQQRNFKYADCIALDYDKGVRLTQAYDFFFDYEAIFATTKSHTVANERFRVIIPFDTRVENSQLYRFICRQFAIKFSSDLAATDAARFFFPCKEIVYLSPGKRIDVKRFDELLMKSSGSQSVTARTSSSVKLTTRTLEHFHAHGAYEPGIRNKTIFAITCQLTRQGCTLEQIIKYISTRTDLNSQEIIRTCESGYRTATGK